MKSVLRHETLAEAGDKEQAGEQAPPAVKRSDRLGPAAKKLLGEAGLSLDDITPTGPRGIVTKGDVLAAMAGGQKPGRKKEQRPPQQQQQEQPEKVSNALHGVAPYRLQAVAGDVVSAGLWYKAMLAEHPAAWSGGVVMLPAALLGCSLHCARALPMSSGELTKPLCPGTAARAAAKAAGCISSTRAAAAGAQSEQKGPGLHRHPQLTGVLH